MKRALFVLAAILATHPLHAQETHAAYERGGKPGAGQKLLAEFAGDWTMVKTFFPSKGEPIKTNGECHQKMVEDGRFLQSDFVFYDKNGKVESTGTGISGFDAKTNKFTTVWYDSHQTTFSIRQSDGTFDGKNVVLWSTNLDAEANGRRTVARAHLEDGGRVLVHRHFVVEDGGKERMVIELRLTRKK